MSTVRTRLNDEVDFVPMGARFRGFCPIVVDVETGGFNVETDALLEVAAIILGYDERGELYCKDSYTVHIEPFEGSNLEPASLEVNGIDPFHPLRIASPEKEALATIFKASNAAVKENQCKRAILVGHNAPFDLNFINAAASRAKVKNNPFHPFSTLDTVTLGAMAYSQTVLSKIAKAASLNWDNEKAHTALYDAHMTAEIFCKIMNMWNRRADLIMPFNDPSEIST